MRLHELTNRLGKVEALDRAAEPLSKVVRRLIPRGRVKDVLSGTWLGHPLHPLLTDVAIGSFSSASVLDLLGGKTAQPAANTLAGLGLVSTLPTVAAGLSDWVETYGSAKRMGVVHASANVVGVALYGASVLARRRGRRGAATWMGLAGMGAMTVGGYLGGHLSYAEGIGVNNTFWQHAPEDWTPVLDESALVDGRPVNVETNGAGVLLYRSGGEICAVSSRCSHAGGPLHEGEFESGCVTCPWHRSVFRLRDGAVVHGPATIPQPAYDVRVQSGKVEVRARA